jgi:hypothetical protein
VPVTHLAAVAGSHVDDEVGFCSYCGRLESDAQRVCSECGLGVRLHTGADVLRSPGAAFLVVRADGNVSAASAAAERLLSVHGVLVDKPLLALIRSPESDGELASAVALAAAGGLASREFDVRVVGALRRRAVVRATVAPCGLPPAALVLLELA